MRSSISRGRSSSSISKSTSARLVDCKFIGSAYNRDIENTIKRGRIGNNFVFLYYQEGDLVSIIPEQVFNRDITVTDRDIILFKTTVLTNWALPINDHDIIEVIAQIVNNRTSIVFNGSDSFSAQASKVVNRAFLSDDNDLFSTEFQMIKNRAMTIQEVEAVSVVVANVVNRQFTFTDQDTLDVVYQYVTNKLVSYSDQDTFSVTIGVETFFELGDGTYLDLGDGQMLILQ